MQAEQTSFLWSILSEIAAKNTVLSAITLLPHSPASLAHTQLRT